MATTPPLQIEIDRAGRRHITKLTKALNRHSAALEAFTAQFTNEEEGE